MTFTKTLGPNGTVLLWFREKQGLDKDGALLLFRLLRRNGGPKDAFS